jgi:regulator of replication initiation timing
VFHVLPLTVCFSSIFIQTSTFESERQAFYDNEQHLKSRILSLTQALNQARTEAAQPTTLGDADTMSIADMASVRSMPVDKMPAVSPGAEVTKESPELVALKLELSTLSTSYTSLQNTLVLLQTQLNDVKRVNQELQEENESYMILLREKTLSGQYDVMGQVGPDSDSEDEVDRMGNTDHGSLRSSARSVLEVVDETEEEYAASRTVELDPDFQQDLDEGSGSGFAGESLSAPRSRGSPQGESLAGLPLTGPGLDLAAELGRAENRDDFSGATSPTPLETGSPRRNRTRKTTPAAAAGRKVSSLASELAVSSSKTDVDTLRKEVKSLKDANKALSLYASKIIDRIIAQEGFEHVLSVDYTEKSPTTPSAATSGFNLFGSPRKADKKARPQSFFGFASSNNAPLSPPGGEKLTTFDSIMRDTSAESKAATPPALSVTPAADAAAAAAAKRGDKRRSFSLDWSTFSIFGGDKKPPPPAGNSNLRPLTLGTTGAAGAPRKLDTAEDEDDRRERERLQATMKLMGIERPPPQPIPLIKSVSTPGEPSAERASEDGRPSMVCSNSTDAVPKTPARWSSLFRSKSTRTADSGASSPALSGVASPNPAELTQDALEHAEAQQKLAALDAHEKALSDQYAKGAGGTTFTEIQPRSSRRSRKSAGGSNSGSTVWSAGMSKDEHSDD